MTPKFLTNPEAQKRIAELEALVAKGKPAPTNSAPMHRAPVAAALQARLDAGKAKFAAAEAQARAKAAAAVVAPGLTTAAQFAAPPLRMSREEFRKLSAPARARFVREGGRIVD